MLYLDHHAATPISAAVREAIASAHAQAWANPSSVHAAGRAARARLEAARRSVARALSVQPADLIFTAGGTEACNLAVLGLFAGSSASRSGARHVVTSELEHPAVLAAVAALGVDTTQLPCAGARMPAVAALEAALRPDTALVALQWVNHETGAIAPIADYAALCRARDIALVIDACQALGKLPCDVGTLGATAVIVASAKLGGPTGAAALWLERGRAFTPTSFGGAQERGRRAGTPEVAAIAGFAAAADAVSERLGAMPQVAARRDRLEAACVELGGQVNGAADARVATVVNASFRGWRAAELVAALDVEGLCASAGAACSSGLAAPSPVLRALYPDQPWRAESALRLSLGPDTGDDDITRAIAILRRVLSRAA